MLDEAPRAVKIILFAVLVVFALAVIATTRNIFVSNASAVWSDCVIQVREIHGFSSNVPSKGDAAMKITDLLGEGAVFIGNEIQPCGVGYLFNMSGSKYFVCEDGSVSKYELVCREEGLGKKGETSFRIVKDSNISQLN